MSWATGKTALVTGGSQGIGHATAQALRDMGAQVLVTGTRAQFSDYDDALDGVTYIQSDLARPEARAALAAQITTLDVLVNNAGTGRPNEYDQDAFETVIDINLNAVMDLSVRLFPALKVARGSIVNVGSLASFLALKETPAYTASKAGLAGAYPRARRQMGAGGCAGQSRRAGLHRDADDGTDAG